MTKFLAISLTWAVFACDRPATHAPPPTVPVVDEAPQTSAGISWIEDDYAGALAAAKRENKPIVIDMWAEWCHTCLSMQHYVLEDKAFEPLADRFVWLSLDTEKEQNSAALAVYPVEFWPTFFILSPTDESVQARYVGAASVAQFREFLVQGEQGHLDAIADGGGLAQDDPLRLVRDGDRASIAGDYAAADTAYQQALDRAPANWARRPDVLVSQISARSKAERWGDCVDLGLSVSLETGNAASAADFLFWAGQCADKLPAKDERKLAMVTKAIERLDLLVNDQSALLSIDDRSDAMSIERAFIEQVGDLDSAKRLAQQQRAMLDKAAADAPDAHAASTYNWPRAEVYVYLGVGAELIADLEASEKAMPSNYDPPYRLAWVHLKLEQNDKALAAANRALERVYGPRRARVLSLLASIHEAGGDKAAALASHEQIVATYEALPEGQQNPASLAAAREALAKLAAK